MEGNFYFSIAERLTNGLRKMYPVGVLFGFGLYNHILYPLTNELNFVLNMVLGFDTASSIALLAITALAQRDADGKGIPRSDIVILPVSIGDL